MTESNNKPPIQKFRVGNVNCAIWENSGEKGPYTSYTFDRSYKDGETWKNIDSFRLRDLPSLAMAAVKAEIYTTMLNRQQSEEEMADAA